MFDSILLNGLLLSLLAGLSTVIGAVIALIDVLVPHGAAGVPVVCELLERRG